MVQAPEAKTANLQLAVRMANITDETDKLDKKPYSINSALLTGPFTKLHPLNLIFLSIPAERPPLYYTYELKSIIKKRPSPYISLPLLCLSILLSSLRKIRTTLMISYPLIHAVPLQVSEDA